jgi:Guanylate-binding protein, N-terminal domain
MNNPLDHKNDWIGEPDEPLIGFSWKSGPTRHTTGVVIWSDVFLHEYNGEKLAIVLMDTQGLFDTKTSAADNSRIFALGTLISSVQIFNLNDVIQENQLEYLQMATDYAKYANSDSFKVKKKPFQNLLFLMRDWVHRNDHNYGSTGGQDYINGVLKVADDQSPQLKVVREYIKSSFDKVNCFLMPHPGVKVIQDPDYDGRISRLTEDFQSNLRDLINWLLDPKSLTKKRILDKEVDGKTFSEYVKTYFETFQSPTTPTIKTLYEVTIERQFTNSMDKAFSFYKEMLDNRTDYKQSNFLETIDLSQVEVKAAAISLFRATKKMGSKEHDAKFEKIFVEKVDSYFEKWKVNVLNTYNQMVAVAMENKKQIEAMQAQVEAQLKEENEKQEAKTRELEAQMAEDLRRIQADSKMKEEEKNREIARIQAENENSRIQNEENHKRLIEEQKLERESMRRRTEEIAKNAAEEIKKLQQEQNTRQAEIEKRVQLEHNANLERLKAEAEERREERRLQKEKEEKQDAARKEEMETLRLKTENDAKVQLARLEREEALRKEEKKERELERKADLDERRKERIEREQERKKDREKFERQLANMPRPSPPSQGPKVCILFVCF